MTMSQCRARLRGASIRFRELPGSSAPRVRGPILVSPHLDQVRFEAAGQRTGLGLVDCRLAAALLTWAPMLQDAGVVQVDHYSTYRPGARVRSRGRLSGHARALAIDAARFHLRDGRVLTVENDWSERERGGEPCPVRADEPPASQLLRRVICQAVERDLFQVVITPHHDRDHQDHVHLELVPHVAWSFVH